MPSNVLISTIIFLCLGSMFGYVLHQKKQFYPTVVYLSKSGAAIAACYAQGVVLALIASSILRKIFFGDLRPVESERLAERCWYALTETGLAFTIFKEETVPVFICLFSVLIFMKAFHWLTEGRVDLIERSVSISRVFHVRIVAVFFILGAIDASFIAYAIQSVLEREHSIQIVFGFEYCILLTALLGNIVKYLLYLHVSFEYGTAESRDVTQTYVAVIMSSIKMVLYTVFFLLMLQLFTFPLFVMRPLYFSLKAFKRAVTNVIMTRRALRYLNTFYSDASPEDLARQDNLCIICREELNSSSKKLPCNHIFHTACLRSWFQRQQTCPTCRYNILRVPSSIQLERVRSTRRAHASTQTDSPTCHSCSQMYIKPTSTPNLVDLGEADLVNILRDKKDELRRAIYTLGDLSFMLETASTAIQRLPTIPELPEDVPVTSTAENPHSSIDVKSAREEKLQTLTTAKSDDVSTDR